MNLAVVGSRNFNDYETMERVLEKYLDDGIKTIISGGAYGADKLSEKFAKEHDIRVKIFKPDWQKYGLAAGPIRNEQIVSYSDKIIAFWDGKSKGTQSTLDFCHKYKKPCEIIKF